MTIDDARLNPFDKRMRISLSIFVAGCSIACTAFAGAIAVPVQPRFQIDGIDFWHSGATASRSNDVQVAMKPIVAQAGSSAQDQVDCTLSAVLSSEFSSTWQIVDVQASEVSDSGALIRQMVTIIVTQSRCDRFRQGEARFIIPNMNPGHEYRLAYRLVPRHNNTDVPRAVRQFRLAKDGALTCDASFSDARLPSDALYANPDLAGRN